MLCKLCDQERKLVRAHIIPEAFFRRARSEDDGNVPWMLVSSTPGLPAKRTRIGIYDQGILCEACERLFQDCDSYAVNLLLDRVVAESHPMYRGGEEVAFTIDSFDYRLLKFFAIAVLWRAAVSTQHYYEHVSLGRYENLAKTSILSGDPGDSDYFATFFCKWSAPESLKELTNVFMSPFREKMEGVNLVRFYLGPVIAYIKTDQRRFPNYFQPAQIRPAAPLVMINRQIERSKDLVAMKMIAANLKGWKFQPTSKG
jgi:hypothetical protein